MKPPIFVVGTMRSGSTLLRLILDSHQNIAIGPETGFMGALSATTAIPGWKYGHEWFTRLGWSRDELDERLRDFYRGMFERYARSQGKDRWGDKTPFHTWHMAEMSRVFPDAVFIGIVRHPGAVVASLRRNFHYDLVDAADYWTSTNVEMVRQAEPLGGRFVLCPYEELVRNTEAVTRGLMSWLGEPWSVDLLQHHRVQAAKGAPPLVDGHTSTREAVDATRATRWHEMTSAVDLVELDRRAGALAAFFGYELAPGRDLGALASLDTESGLDGPLGLIDGPRLTERRRRWEARVNFTARPQPIAPDTPTEDLLDRAARAEAALARLRNRRVVRVSDALRQAQRDRSVGQLRAAVRILAGRADVG